MKTTMRLLTALLVIGFLGTISLAESDGPGWGKGKEQRRHKRERKEKFGRGDKMGGEKFCGDIDATPKQRKQLKQIWATHSQAMKNWQNENGKKLSKARKALKEAKKSEDKEAIDAAKLKLQKINKSRRDLRKNLREQLSEVLTKEQMQKMKKIRKRRGPGGHPKYPGMMGKGPYGKLNLTDKQKTKIKRLRTEAAEKAKSAETREEKREIFKNLRKKINKDVLTKEQRTKAAKHFRGKQKGHRDMFLKRLGATDEQKTKIDKIMKKACEKAEGKDPDERRKIMVAAHEKIRKNVLTEQQRKKMQKRKMQWRRKHFDRLGLTKDQRVQANKILTKAEKKAEGKSPKECREIMMAAHKKIHKKVLTDEQREKLEKMKDGWRKGKGKKKFGGKECPGKDRGRRGPKQRKTKCRRKHRDRERDDDDDDD